MHSKIHHVFFQDKQGNIDLPLWIKITWIVILFYSISAFESIFHHTENTGCFSDRPFLLVGWFDQV